MAGQPVQLAARIQRLPAEQSRVIVLRVGEQREATVLDGQLADDRALLAARRPERQLHLQSRYVARQQQQALRLVLVERIERLESRDAVAQHVAVRPGIAAHADLDDMRGDDMQPQHSADLLRRDLHGRDPAGALQGRIGAVAQVANHADRLLPLRHRHVGE